MNSKKLRREREAERDGKRERGEIEKSFECKAVKNEKGQKRKKAVIDRRARPHFVCGVKLGGQAGRLSRYRQTSSW